jgi:predicted N-acetyltransferase YhbS
MEGPRSLKPQEFESLCDLVNAVFRANGPGRMEAQYPLLFSEDNFDGLLVMVDEGRVVSHVGTLTRDISVFGHRIRTISIGAVATLDAYRGRGLATRLMDAAVRKGRAEDSALMLISGGRGLYRRMGATRAGQYALFTAPRSLLPSGHADIAPAEEADIAGLLRLYAQEPVRYLRSASDFRINVRTGWICDRAGETLAIRKNGRLLAYVATQRPIPDAAGEADRVRLVELAGSRMAIFQAFAGLMGRYRVDKADLITPVSDREMAHILSAYGIFMKPERFPGTSLVLLPAPFLDVFADYVAAMLGPGALTWEVAADHITFTCKGRSLTVTPSTLGQLWFGTVEPDADPRLSVPEGTPLREALDAILPVQLPWYGHNFV